MRALKFRAWDKHNKSMTPSFTIQDFGASDIGELKGIEGFEDCQSFLEDAPIMQFTGLLDKHGKEIYEGDICTYGETKGVVAYEVQAGCYWLKWTVQTMQRTVHRYKDLAYGGQEGWQNEIRMTGIEVIGNIHEHPHLLTP